ncbi:DUF4624 family lipoprotein [Qiania dongpingensis]|uniref:DUF4624 family lipoprotein n=1 Tax=Qiania dongpingensis TaxID=2763669 RepID=A0A7G9G462_9FIRM|nr:DUF4624 family lipoprotein [Qiania dongpingensis]QNM05594.1 DUF4624 family lipoprotein [Qiania dongpingensis]
MFHTNKMIIFLVGMISAVSLTACSRTNDSQSSRFGIGNTEKTVLEMEMDAHYSNSDPFENGLLFCVSEDVETLDAEVSYQMDGERGRVEIKDRNSDEILWSKIWDENVSDDTFTILLENLQKEKEYVVQFTGTKIKYAVVKISFDGNLFKKKQDLQNKIQFAELQYPNL